MDIDGRDSESNRGDSMNPTPNPVVQISGYFQMDLGLGHSVRLMESLLKESGVSFGYKNYTNAGAHRIARPWNGSDSLADHAPVHICGVNLDNVRNFSRDHPEMFTQERYVIGMWFWEVPVIPEKYLPAINSVDEIWVATEYMRDIFRKYCDKPVNCYPQPIAIPEKVPKKTPERKTFRFYFSFDFCSLCRRKNPDGLIRAFKLAFPEPGEADLLIKSVNGHLYPAKMQDLRSLIQESPHIHLIDGHLPQDDLETLQESIDGYASLHRSEGYGLSLAAAMASGKPVLATAHSGNMTFMNHANSFLVPFELVPVGPDAAPYPPEAEWAEPDETAASLLMVEMVRNDHERRAKVTRAAEDIRASFSVETGSRWAENRIDEILRQMREAITTPGQNWSSSCDRKELLEDPETPPIKEVPESEPEPVKIKKTPIGRKIRKSVKCWFSK